MAVGLASALLVVPGCGEPSLSDGPLAAVMSQSGDTMIVEVRSGSTWESPARLVEELRIGELEGNPDYTFGQLTHVAPTPGGGVVAFDAPSVRLMSFDADGVALGVIGGAGEGPGEYGADITGLAVLDDRVFLSDLSNARTSVYELSGEFIGTAGKATRLRNQFELGLVARHDGSLLSRILMVMPGPGVEMPDPWPIGFEVRGTNGEVTDTIRPQSFHGVQSSTLEALPWGGLLVDSRDQFEFELREPDGRAVRVQMPFERVPYSEAEVRSLGPVLRAIAAADGSSDPDAPKLKGTYLEYLFNDEEVWARRPAQDSGEGWSSAQYQISTLDVFRRDGTYLGEVQLPPRTRPVAVTARDLYVVELGELDEPYIVRYRVQRPD